MDIFDLLCDFGLKQREGAIPQSKQYGELFLTTTVKFYKYTHVTIFALTSLGITDGILAVETLTTQFLHIKL